MSDEYSVHTRFLLGRLDEAGYVAKLEYMAAQERAEIFPAGESREISPRVAEDGPASGRPPDLPGGSRAGACGEDPLSATPRSRPA